MEDRSVLADRFVPNALESINHWPPTVVWNALELPVLDQELVSIYSDSVPPPLRPCTCSKNASSKTTQGNGGAKAATTPGGHVQDVPFRRVVPELVFAIERRKKQLYNSFASKSMGKEDADDEAGDLVLSAVNDIKDPITYRNTFEAILVVERKEVLLLYERYSHYDLPIELRERDDGASHFVATIPGIGDAHPPVQLGDIVLLRPTKKIALPTRPDKLRNDFRGAPKWTQPVHRLEIHSQVTSIVRDFPTRPGGIQATWLQPQLSKILKQVHPQGKYNIRIIPNTKVIARCLTALDWLFITVPPDMIMQMLFPDTAPHIVSLTTPGSMLTEGNDTPDDSLNDKQVSFCQLVLSRTRSPSIHEVRAPTILTGPAGTGKTKTLLAAVRCLLEKNKTHGTKHRILVCTSSHTAADVVCRRLGKFLDRKELFRLYDADRALATVPVTVLKFARQSTKSGAFALPQVQDLLSFQVIVCTCSDSNLLYTAGLTNHQLRRRRRCFQESIVTACRGRNISAAIDGTDEPHFTHLFIDEAAQATEPETLIPFSVVVDPLVGPRKVEIALIGDPRQLQPAVYSSTAAAAGLDRSLMERLLKRPVRCLGDGNEDMLGPNPVLMEDWLRYSFEKDGQEQLSIFLTTNYRGHASFLMLPSALFYGDKLLCADKVQDGDPDYWCQKLRGLEAAGITMVKAADNGLLPDELQQRKQFAWPMLFRGVCGKDASVTIETFAGSNSWSNQLEAEAVADIVVGLTEQGVSSESIGVMAPFRGQVVKIRKLLRSKNLGAVDVGTIEDYQAVERDVIVLSLTRSTQAFVMDDIQRRMGVFGQPKRSNVALTRAENLLIVVGDPNTMAKDSVWRQFLWFCLRNGLWYGDTGETMPIFSWGESHRLVRHRAHDETSAADERELQVVAVSTLERLLRE